MEVVVQKGDTLWKLAKKHLGDGSLYTEIAAANGIKNANKLSVGKKLIIPTDEPAPPTPREKPKAAPVEGVPPGVGANKEIGRAHV